MTQGLFCDDDDNTVGRGKAGWGLILSALLIQLVLLGFSMPLSEFASGNWFFHIDNPYHIYQLELGRALQSQGLWMGYDPFFGAGQLAGLSSNVSARFSLIFAWLMPSKLPTTTIYTTYVLVCSILAPLSIWGLGRFLGWSRWHTTWAFVIGLLLWWVGVFRWFHTAGMVSFVCASYLAPLYAVWVYSLCRPTMAIKPLRILLAGLAGGAGMWLHPLFCILVAVLFLSIVVFELRKQDQLLPFFMRATGIAFIAALLTLPWVLALIQVGSQTSGVQPYQREVGLHVIYNSLGFNAGGATGAWINLVIVAICLLGTLFVRSCKQTFMWPFFLAGISLLLFSALAGGSSTLAVVQPNRLIGPAYLLFGLIAAYEIACLIGLARTSKSHIALAGILIIGALLTIYFGRELARELASGIHGHHGKAPPEITTPPKVVKQLEDWIRTNTNGESRILFETSLGRVHGGGHIVGYLAAKTHREFMGAAYPYFSPKLSCWDRSCFGQPLSKLQPEYFQTVIDVYNVGWVIAHSSELKSFLHSMPGINLLTELEGISIYKVNGFRSFVQEGSAQVIGRNFNRVQLGNVSGSILTLRYHWAPGLETVPQSQIEPYTWSPDFPPLIRIINPPTSFMLRKGK